MIHLYILCGEKNFWEEEDIKEATGIENIEVLINCDITSIKYNEEMMKHLIFMLFTHVQQACLRYKIYKKVSINCKLRGYTFYKPKAVVLANNSIAVVADKEEHITVPACNSCCNISCEDKERLELAGLLYDYLSDKITV